MITDIQDIKTDLFYTLWLYMPSTDYHVAERTYPGQYVKDVLWSETQEHNRNNTRQYKFFPQHTNPNENEMKYEIIVGNIGTITAETQEEAQKTYAEYVQQSRSGYGRAAGEQVTLLVDGEIEQEHTGEMK